MSYDERLHRPDRRHHDLLATRTPPAARTRSARPPTAPCGAARATALIHVNSTGSGGVRYPRRQVRRLPLRHRRRPGRLHLVRPLLQRHLRHLSRRTARSATSTPAPAKVTAFNTGSRTAPADLVQGPDGNMWFTSIGAAAGIGHLSRGGRGALTAIGGYEPTSLTFAKDGAIFATDATNNVIIRVTTDQLQRTNVDPGAGSVLVGGAAGAQVSARSSCGRSRSPSDNAVALRLTCPKSHPALRRHRHAEHQREEEAQWSRAPSTPSSSPARRSPAAQADRKGLKALQSAKSPSSGWT